MDLSYDGLGVLMTYHPLAETHDTGEAYFTSLGLLGASTGMAPLITASTTIPAFDDYDGTVLPITDSVAGPGVAFAISWAGWDLAAAKTKLLMTTYTQPSTSDWCGIGCHTGTLPTAGLEDCYTAMLYGNASRIDMAKYTTGVGWATIGNDATIYQAELATAPVWGIGLYVDQTGGSEVQKIFVKSGSAQWIQVLSTSDTSHSSFQSVFLDHRGSNARFISPIMMWGA